MCHLSGNEIQIPYNIVYNTDLCSLPLQDFIKLCWTVHKSYLSSRDNITGCLTLKEKSYFISRLVSVILCLFFL
jgi:hypothetical protein